MAQKAPAGLKPQSVAGAQPSGITPNTTNGAAALKPQTPQVPGGIGRPSKVMTV